VVVDRAARARVEPELVLDDAATEVRTVAVAPVDRVGDRDPLSLSAASMLSLQTLPEKV
jgi:hypothetical protein